MLGVNKNPDREVIRKFGKAMMIGFAVLAVLVWLISYWRAPEPRGLFAWVGNRAQIAAAVFAALGPALFLMCYAAPLSVSRPVYVVWMSIGMFIGVYIATPVLFTLLFIIVLPVFSLIRFSDPLGKKLKKEGSYWEDYRHHEATVDRMLRPF